MSTTNISQSPRSPQQTPEQELRAAYHQLEETYQTHKLALPEMLAEGNTKAANLANEYLSAALQQFRDAEARMNYTLEDGRVIRYQDYHGLKQLADGNGLPVEDVLSGCGEIADKRILQLDLINKKLTQLGGIEYLTELRRLELWGNRIADVGLLAGLVSLEQLYLNHNQISDIGPLAGLTALQMLGLGSNQIADVDPLAGLAALKLLSIDGNQIADIGPLAGLAALRNLFLSGVPHTETNSRVIRELEQRGVNVRR